MPRGSTARATPRRRRPPVADVRVTRPDGTVEVWTAARWERETKKPKAEPEPDVPYPLPFGAT
jgi:hypothetical protein